MNLPIGTLVNIAAVVAGSLIGVTFNKKLPEKYRMIIFQGIGLVTLVLGVTMALKVNNFLLLIFSVLIGGLLGEWIDLEQRLEKGSDWLKGRLKIKESKFSEGLITAFLIFCVGSMTIVGAINEGVSGTHDLLYTKSVLDGFISIALASTFGIGVLFSIVPMLLFQGGLTLFASVFQGFFTTNMISQLVAVGGVLILGIGFNLLEIKKIKVVNLLPALLISMILSLLFK